MICDKFILDIDKKASTKEPLPMYRVVTAMLRLVFKLFNSDLVSLSRGWDRVLLIMQE